MVKVLAIMIILFVALAIVFMIKIKNTALRIVKSNEVNNKNNEYEKNFQFIKGLY